MTHLAVEFRDFNLATSESVEAVSRKILGRTLHARKLHTLYILNKRGREATEAPDNCFVINIDAHPERVGVQDPPNKLWGKSFKNAMEAKWRIYEPSGEGLVVVEPKDGTVVAEIVGNTLTILVPLYKGNFISESDWLFVYEQILLEAHQLYGPTFPTLQELFEGHIPKKGQTVDDLARPEQAIAEMQRYVSQTESLWDTTRKQVSTGDSEALVLAKILLGIPEVKNLEVNGDKLIVHTHNMYAEHARTKKIHVFGEFRVTLTFGNNARAEFKNLTRTVYHNGDGEGDYGHPHVQRAGDHWCTGEGSGIISQLRHFEFQAAVLFALKAISSVNNSDSGNYQRVLSLFPTVETQPAYPDKSGVLNDQIVMSLAKMLQKSTGAARVDVQSEYEQSIKRVRDASCLVLTETFAYTLKRVRVEEIGARLRAEINTLSENEKIEKVALQGDGLQVITKPLVAKEDRGGTSYAIGSFTLTTDFSSGQTELKSSTVRRRGDKTYYAPHLTKELGLPVNQLLITIPTLFGELEWDTAVTLLLEAIESFDESFATPESLALFVQTH